MAGVCLEMIGRVAGGAGSIGLPGAALLVDGLADALLVEIPPSRALDTLFVLEGLAASIDGLSQLPEDALPIEDLVSQVAFFADPRSPVELLALGCYLATDPCIVEHIMI